MSEKKLIQYSLYVLLAKMVRPGHWNSLENQREFARGLAETYGWAQMEDWYSLKKKHFEECGGAGLLVGIYKGSPTAFLNTVFPNELWLPWKFTNTPQGFWNSAENARFFFDWMAQQKEFKSIDGFYSVSQNEYRQYGGMGLQRKFNGSRLEMLKFAYPCKEWCEWKFHPRLPGYFDNLDNLRKAIKSIEKELGITTPEDWYQYTAHIIDEHLGSGLLANKYKWSLSYLLATVYPDYSWKGYKFSKAPSGYWDNILNQREWLSDFMESKGFTSYEQLYDVICEDINSFYGRGLTDYYGGSYIRAFLAIVPDFPWEENRFRYAQISRGETEWLDSLEKIYGPIQRQYRIEGTKLSLDGAQPEKKMGFLYHGSYWHGDPRVYPNRDEINPNTGKTYGILYQETLEKEEFWKKEGWTLIVMWEFDWKNK